MKKQWIFVLLIVIILYVSYKIIDFKYREYKINSSINYIEQLNIDIQTRINEAQGIIEYKTSSAYKNKILKEQQWFKNKGEVVVYLMPEDRFNIYTQDENLIRESIQTAKENEENTPLNEMTVFEKRIYFIFKEEVKL